MTVVTRFAPSPTGFLHIGGARTALFNWLFAKHMGGQFLLRIEDTDRARSTGEAIAAILDSMQWLGLDWDGKEVYQFSRADRHAEVARAMLDSGHAYRCFTTAEELAALRAGAEAEGKIFHFKSPWRDADASTWPDAPYAIRLRAPQNADITIKDAVQGDVIFPAEQMDDLILLRSDGTPTYMLAVVVDDHDMGVTHVIRGDDHLTNAARQTLIYQAMGWDVPVWAHIPLIHGPDGAKLSKRHGALGAEQYREMGFLPEAMRNYLLRLGWGHGDEEIIPTERAIELFTLDGIGRAPARFDMAKLEHLNAHYLRTMDEDTLFAEVESLAGTLNELQKTRLRSFLPELKQRAVYAKDIIAEGDFLLASRPLTLTEQAQKALKPEALPHITALLPKLESAEWNADALHHVLNDYATEAGIKAGAYMPAMRAALTGKHASAGNVAGIMAVLGREEALARLKDAL
jgi:glutamyl-tRNA synthetase